MVTDIRSPRTNKLLCRYDAERQLLEFREKGMSTLVDLRASTLPCVHDWQEVTRHADSHEQLSCSRCNQMRQGPPR